MPSTNKIVSPVTQDQLITGLANAQSIRALTFDQCHTLRLLVFQFYRLEPVLADYADEALSTLYAEATTIETEDAPIGALASDDGWDIPVEDEEPGATVTESPLSVSIVRAPTNEEPTFDASDAAEDLLRNWSTTMHSSKGGPTPIACSS